MRNRCCYWAYLPANSPGEYAALGKVAEGEELGSNLLRVRQRTLTSSIGGGSSTPQRAIKCRPRPRGHHWTRREGYAGLVTSAILTAAPSLTATEATVLELPPPRTEGGKRLIQALKLRRSIREYSDRPLPVQVLSDLLWAAFGINRPSGDRTAPYWRHIMVIDVYVAMADGVWLYEPKRRVLLPHSRDDIRAQTGLQDFVANAPLNLVYVAHGERMRDISANERRLYASVDSGFIGQNVYLFCASEGLATVFRGAVDYEKLNRTMQLDADQFVTFAQTVGYSRD
jgi:nitroreductase